MFALNKFKGFLLSVFFLTVFADIAHAMSPPPGGGNGAAPQGIDAIIKGPLPMMIVIFGIFYFLLIRPQSKKAKEHKAMLENLKKGDKVLTNGGIYGLVEDIDEKTATLKIGIKDDVKIKIDRGYIAAIREKEQG